MKLVYLGSPDAAVPPLRALVGAGHEVLLVVSQPDRKRGRGGGLLPSPVKAAALSLGITVTDQPNDVLQAVEAGAELGVVVAYGRLIKPVLLDALPFVNLHFSLLPRWRGAAPVERAVLAGDAETGVCLMALEAGLDTGPVFRRVSTPIGADESVAALRDRLVDLGTVMLIDALADGPLDPAVAVAQTGTATYAAKLDPTEFAIDWTLPAATIARLTRLGSAWTVFRGKRLKVLEAVAEPVFSSANPGSAGLMAPTADGVTADGVTADGVTAASSDCSRIPGSVVDDRSMVRATTGLGIVRLLRIQPEGKAPMDATAWRNGVQPTARERFGA